MNSLASAAFFSWNIDWRVIVLLVTVAALYLRGWVRTRRLLRDERDLPRLCAFLGGLGMMFLATESPLDAFDSLFLSAHMTQHLLLMMIAPPLLLLGHPVLPFLRGLPRQFVREGLGPFLTWPWLRRTLAWLISPPVAWVAFAVSTILWHLPRFYELALSSPSWHAAQHASFFWTGILFWWPVVQPGPGKPKWPRWTMIPYLLFADVVNTVLSAFFIFSGRILYPSYEGVRASGLNPQDDQTIAGGIMWVPGSLVYILPAIVIAMRLFSGARSQRHEVFIVKHDRKLQRLFSLQHWRLPLLRRVAQVSMLLLAIAVMTDGFFGPQVTPLNMAGVLPWIQWRALAVLALLAIGNLFCMACPFMLVRDMGRRFLPAKWRWPRILRTKWIAAGLLVLYFWGYEAFGLWDSPWLTAWVITGYFLAALAIDGFFRGASFCKYVCPIGQFHFVSSLMSPREIAVRSAAVCKTCRTHDCIRGNERTRGCELYLFQPRKTGNLDCTFCLDCVKACPEDNIALLPVLPASTLLVDPHRSSLGVLSRRTDLAVLTLIIVFGAFVNAAGMVNPVMMWEHDWHARLGAHTMPLIVAALVITGVLVIPATAVFLCGLANRLTGPDRKIADLARRFVFALVPIGFAMWAAHLLYHFVTGWNAPWTMVQRFSSGIIHGFAMASLPGWLTSAQILILDAGLLLTLYVIWRIARQSAGRVGTALGLATPWALVSCALYAAGIWILFQPMQMRGMLH